MYGNEDVRSVMTMCYKEDRVVMDLVKHRFCASMKDGMLIDCEVVLFCDAFFGRAFVLIECDFACISLCIFLVIRYAVCVLVCMCANVTSLCVLNAFFL